MSFFDSLPHRYIAKELGEPFTLRERLEFYFPRAAYRIHRIANLFRRTV